MRSQLRPWARSWNLPVAGLARRLCRTWHVHISCKHGAAPQEAGFGSATPHAGSSSSVTGWHGTTTSHAGVHARLQAGFGAATSRALLWHAMSTSLAGLGPALFQAAMAQTCSMQGGFGSATGWTPRVIQLHRAMFLHPVGVCVGEQYIKMTSDHPACLPGAHCRLLVLLTLREEGMPAASSPSKAAGLRLLAPSPRR